MEKNEKEIEKKIERFDEIISWAKSKKDFIEKDERFHCEPVNVFINPSRALIQVALEAQHRCLFKILNMAKGTDNGKK